MIAVNLTHPLRFTDFTLPAGTPVLVDESAVAGPHTVYYFTAWFTLPEHREFGRMATTGRFDSFEIHKDEFE